MFEVVVGSRFMPEIWAADNSTVALKNSLSGFLMYTKVLHYASQSKRCFRVTDNHKHAHLELQYNHGGKFPTLYGVLCSIHVEQFFISTMTQFWTQEYIFFCVHRKFQKMPGWKVQNTQLILPLFDNSLIGCSRLTLPWRCFTTASSLSLSKCIHFALQNTQCVIASGFL